MPAVEENFIYKALLQYKGDAQVKIGSTDLNIKLDPIDNHIQDSPDFLIWVDISFKVFGQQLNLRVPIPIEAEKVGIYGAMEDIQKMIERKKHPIQLPMVVVAESEFDKKIVQESFPTNLSIYQIPIRAVNIIPKSG